MTDPNRLALMDDSAGGNMCAAMTLKAREVGHPVIAAQTLRVPVVDHSFKADGYTRNAERTGCVGRRSVVF
ncbi:alpha/beta hydrolase fold domain-containing protein [uncultured Tateyamaria sp.]|uniref:alpha/beta hydrolase fold domain-containing protein n=1 Tax=uncultured Tateyamaria sp. TaxID=455651 RepID=UPI00342C28AE